MGHKFRLFFYNKTWVVFGLLARTPSPHDFPYPGFYPGFSTSVDDSKKVAG